MPHVEDLTEAKLEPGHGRPGTVADYHRLSGLSINSIRAAIGRGEIQVLRFGRRLIIPAVEFDRLSSGRAA